MVVSKITSPFNQQGGSPTSLVRRVCRKSVEIW
jgi:hypothetical protein